MRFAVLTSLLPPPLPRNLRLLVMVIFCLAAFVGEAPAKGPNGQAEIGTIAVAELPPEGRETLALIRKGGPFPHKNKDGSVFGNRERALPLQPRGYYREYTVKTPGSRDRGARRIVCGGDGQPTCFYTADHYATFRRIVE